MAKFAEPRPLTTKERTLLEFMLSADFAGRDDLRSQLESIEVIADCDCGCGTVNFRIKDSVRLANSREPIPVEAYTEGLDVLLFVRKGRLSSLEIVDHGDSRPITYPAPSDLKLWVPPSEDPGRRRTSRS